MILSGFNGVHMNRLKITLGLRLALSYGLVIVLLILVALFVLETISDLRATSDGILKKRYPRIALISQINNDLEVIARAMRNTLFLREENEIKKQLTEITSTKSRLNSEMYTLQMSSEGEIEKAILDEIDIVNSAYAVNQDDFVSLVADGRMNEAKNLLLVDINPYQTHYFELLQKLNHHQNELMKNSSQNISLKYDNSRRVILIAVAISLLSCLIITIMISRGLLRQLGGEPEYASDVALNIAQGNVDVKIHTKPGDQESLLFVMSLMRDSLNERTSALVQKNHELNSTLEALKRTQDELLASEKLAALGSLVAGVSHELNTPIGVCVTAASTMVDRTKIIAADLGENRIKRSVLEDYIQDMLTGGEIVQNNLYKMSELIVDFKQVSVAKELLEYGRFNLSELINETVNSFRSILSQRAIAYVDDVDCTITMDSYSVPLARVLINLMQNSIVHAFNFSMHGCIKIQGRMLSDSVVQLIISDDGIGIPPENLSRIYEPFFTTKMGHGGSGLGMHIVYNIIKNVLHGSIKTTSIINIGTQVELLLPIKLPKE